MSPSGSSRRPTRTNGSTASLRSPKRTKVERSTSRSARRWTHRRRPSSPRSRQSDSERGYPPSIGTAALRQAASRWIERRFEVAVDPMAIGATVGSKEFVGTLPQWLRLRSPDRDTVLYPATSYPTYEMGAILAGCRAGGGPPRCIRPLGAGRHQRRRRRPCAGAVGQQPGQPDGRPGGPRGGRRVGTGSRGARVLRRVLRRVHLGRPGPQHPAARHTWCDCRALALQALQSRRRADRLLRRRR